MKHIILILFVLLSVQVFSQEKLNQTDAKGLRQGIWEKYYPNGGLIYEGQFENGKPVGTWKRYHDNGYMKANIVYSESSDSAKTKLYDEAGNLMAEGVFLNEQKVGLWKYFSRDNVVSEEEYESGLKHGKARRYYSSGEVLDETEWQNNLKDGKYRAFFKSGNPFMECVYKYGLRDGFCISYYENGRMEVEAFYENDMRHNNWNYYSETGELLFTIQYDHNQILNPEVLDSIQNERLNELEKNKGKIPDPADFLDNPSEYMIRNRMNR